MHKQPLRYAGADIVFEESDKCLQDLSREISRRPAAPSRSGPSERTAISWAAPYHPRYAAFGDDIAHQSTEQWLREDRKRHETREETVMKRGLILAPTVLIASLVLAIKSPEAATAVNCDHNGTITQALEKGKDLVIKGTCNESPTITTDDVTLRPHPSGGEIFGAIKIDGAQRVTIEGLIVSGSPKVGIRVTNGATATIRENDVSGHEVGIAIADGAFARIERNTVYDNGETGVSIARASAIGDGNMIMNNGIWGLEVNQHSSYRSKSDTITQDLQNAIEVDRSSYADLREGAMSGRAIVGRLSMLLLRGTVEGDINVGTLSQYSGPEPEVGMGTLHCNEPTSVCQIVD
jgi:hypothetical protein